MAEPLRHRQTKGAETDMPSLPPPRHIPTLPKLRFHVPFDVDVRSHVQPHGYGSEGWSVHSRHTAVLSTQRGTAELTAIKFLKFFL
jgi:hypothetical protein